jgi:hypothetical protein
MKTEEQTKPLSDEEIADARRRCAIYPPCGTDHYRVERKWLATIDAKDARIAELERERDEARDDHMKTAEAWGAACDERDANRTEIERLRKALEEK